MRPNHHIMRPWRLRRACSSTASTLRDIHRRRCDLGFLSVFQTASTGVTDTIDGLTLDPTGAFLVGSLFFTQQIAVLKTATMTPVPKSPFVEDGASASAISWATDVFFNNAGTILFTADANYSDTQVSSYGASP